MLTVIIKDDGEKSVVDLTYKNLWRELKDIPGAELLVSKDWLSGLSKVKNTYVCFVEADCLVSSGYFDSMIGLFSKTPMLRKLAMMSSSTCVGIWVNKFYGYSIQNADKKPFIQPNREMKSRAVYPVQVGYVPGALIRTASLKTLLAGTKVDVNNLMLLSSQISLGFWGQGDGNRVHINPNSAYVTTETYVNDLGQFNPGIGELMDLFNRESIGT